MKRLLVVACVLGLFVGVAAAQEKQYEVPGVFSFSYGDGWNKGPRKGATGKELDWLVSVTHPNASFHAVMARADFSYDDWIKKTIKTANPDRILESKGEFVSLSGEKGYKLVWKVKAANGEQFVKSEYLFRGKGDTQILLSGTVDVADAPAFDPVFDGFGKSFAIIKTK